MVYRYVCNGFLRQIRLRSYQSALPVPRILVLCNHLQNVVATTYIFRLQLSTFIFYNKQPSEKAFAYKMKLEAMKQQGKRTDLTSSQLEKKLENKNPTLQLAEITCGTDENGCWNVCNTGGKTNSNYANEKLAKQVGESRAQISRYIRLTNLIPKILNMVDEGKIAFTVAVELSYLKEEEQYELHAIMDLEQCTPSLSQACRLKVMSQHGTLNMDAICMVLEEEKPNQREQIKLRADSLEKYFPKDYTPKQKTDLIEQLLKEWYEKQENGKISKFY